MDGTSRVSDFSIDRILSPQLGHKQPAMEFSPDGYLYGLPGGFSLDSGTLRAPAPVPVPVPVPVPGCLQYRGMGFGEAYCPYGAGFHHSSMYPNSGVYVHFGSSSPDSAGKLWLQLLHFNRNRLTFHHRHEKTFLTHVSLPPDAQQLAGYHGYHQAGVSAQSQLRQKSRMRTVFTDSQTKRLEALFELTDYPAVEARAEVARSTGLSEETVRVSPT